MNNLLSELLIAVMGGYLVGSFPVGPLMVYLSTKKNILQLGSKSAGATNVARLLGLPYFFIVLILDAAKSYYFLYVLSFYCFNKLLMLCIASLALLMGNRYSLFLGAQGGKGVATSLGIITLLFPHTFLLFVCAVWLIVLITTKKIGVASLTAAASCLIACIVCSVTRYASYHYYLGIIISMHVLYCHTSHIKKLLYSD